MPKLWLAAVKPPSCMGLRSSHLAICAGEACFCYRKRLGFGGSQAFLSCPLSFQQADVLRIKGLTVLPLLSPEIEIRQRKCQNHAYADRTCHVTAAAKPTTNSNHAAGYRRLRRTCPERIKSGRRRNRVCPSPGLEANACSIQSDNSRYRR